ncbi:MULTISPECIES: HNH endonuclease signature motif containing protein [Nocardioides]|uniref:HNH endonuclease signature motif containing protein n=1 Tax=Nocardioides TaxID=1839 RepID=UPI001E6233E5|nr:MULTISPECIES: HNH endonuclease signature motif containing protein [unclassified Nocardioides]
MARRTATLTDPVLAAARDAAHAEVVAAARKFELAATWAAMHPAPVTDPVVTATGVVEMYGDQPVTLAGEGAPGMSEFAVAEFAAAIGISTRAGRDLIGAALECRHRLPRVWARVMAGEVPVWKVRRLTEQTHRLPMTGAAYVDRHLAPVLDSCSFAQIERAVETACAQTEDEKAELDRLDAAATEFFQVRLGDAHLNNGRVPVDGLLDYPVALALEQALQAGSHHLLAEHPELTLDQRRALALGHLAAGSAGVAEVVVYAHHTPAEGHGIVDVEKLGHTTTEQLTDWCRHLATRVTIRPVLDLDAELTTDCYAPTVLQREQAVLTNPTCVFAHCARSAQGCDLDHIEPWDPTGAGGATTSWNLAPLCRLHHRMKTHGHWTYRRLSRTRFEWTSPSGDLYDVDRTLTRRRTR